MLWRVGSHGHAGQEREEHIGECTRKMVPQIHCLGNWERLNFLRSCNLLGLKPRVLKSVVLAGIQHRGHCLLLQRRQETSWGQTAWKQYLKNTRRTQDGYYSLFSELFHGRQHSSRGLSRDKGSGWPYLPPLVLSVNAESPEGGIPAWTLVA